MIYFVVPREQEFGIRNYAESWGKGFLEFVTLVYYEDLPGRAEVPAGTWVFSALDQLTPRGMGLVLQLQAQLRESPARCRVLNDARRVLLRLELLEELYRRGQNRHRAVRATGDVGSLRFPVFLREEFRHNGALTPLLHTPKELERALGSAVLRGHRLSELLVVEFWETVDPAGRYHKYAAYRVGSEIICRSLARGPAWMLKHEGAEFSEELFLEERDYVMRNPHREELERIFATAGIDYGRIDYSMTAAGIETWEINSNPTVGPGHRRIVPGPLAPIREPARDEFSRRFQAAFRAVDTVPPGPPIPVKYRDSGRGPLLLPAGAAGLLARFAGALRPFRPLLDRAARIFSPLIARAARRGQADSTRRAGSAPGPDKSDRDP